MTDLHANGRFDVVATGELLGSFEGADERSKLLRALNADPDLCSALLCGEQSLLCSGVGWAQAQAFVELMRDCGVVAEVVSHGEERSIETDVSSMATARPGAGRGGQMDASSLSAALQRLYGGADPGLDGVVSQPKSQHSSDTAQVEALVAESEHAAMVEEISAAEAAIPASRPAGAMTLAESAAEVVADSSPFVIEPLPGLYEAEVFESEVVAEAPPSLASTALRTTARVTEVVIDDSGDIPTYLLEADARERQERRRRQRRWGVASLLVLGAAMVAAFSSNEEVYSSSQAFVHVLASPVPASADGVVAELLVAPGQALERGEAVAVITAAGSQRQIEVVAVAGSVDQVVIKVGQRVERGDALLTLTHPGSAYLLAYFPAEQLRELPQGGVVQVDLDDFPGQPVLGRLAAMAERRGEDRARAPVRIDFEDELPLLRKLRSGMAARVTVRQPQLSE